MLVTLTTDFGEASPYVAALKGVLLGVNPGVRFIDLSHQIPPQDLRHAAFFLQEALPYFPDQALHVVVVDPGVGSERAILYVEVAGRRLLVPDNGCWTQLGEPSRVLRLTESRFWRHPVSYTFHGRDVFAPVAGALSLGTDPAILGVPAPTWVRFPVAVPQPTPDGVAGEVAFVDHFGNLITNIPARDLDPRRLDALRVAVGTGVARRWVRAYADARPGDLVALASSGGRLEVAVVQGSAAQRLGAGTGTGVRVTWG